MFVLIDKNGKIHNNKIFTSRSKAEIKAKNEGFLIAPINIGKPIELEKSDFSISVDLLKKAGHKVKIMKNNYAGLKNGAYCDIKIGDIPSKLMAILGDAPNGVTTISLVIDYDDNWEATWRGVRSISGEKFHTLLS